MNAPPGRVLGIDPGRVRFGLALSDPMGIIAGGIPVLHSQGRAKDLAAISDLVARNEVAEVVVGLPLNLDGTDSRMTTFARSLATDLEARTGLPVRLWDERLTSAHAERALLEGGARREKRRDRRDQIAAVLILQSYLDWRAAQSPA